MKMKKILLAALLATCIGSPALASPIYNAVADFSNPQAAPWSYGYTMGTPTGSFIPFTSFTSSYLGVSGLNGWYVSSLGFDLPTVIKNTTGGDLVYSTVTQPNTMLNLHPMVTPGGTLAFSVVRFTAPSTSFHSVDAFFQGLDSVGPTTTDVSIYLLLNSQLAGTINSYGAGGRIPYSGNLFMAAGDTLDFAVGPGNGFYNDSTGFDATITAVPEPATLSLLGLGLLGLGAALRARRK